MGAALFIVVNSEDPGFDTMVDGKSVARHDEQLAAIATELGVTPLLDFFGVGSEEFAAAIEEFGISPGDAAGAEGVVENWFPPQDGIRTVAALIGHLEKAPSAIDSSGDVLADLRAFASVLKKAEAKGLKWRLQVDY